MTGEELKCIKCGQIDKVQKVSALRSGRLSPPAKPANPGVSGWVWGIGVLLIVLGIIALDPLLGPETAVYCLLPGIVILAGALVVYSNRKQRFDEEMPQWQRLMRMWNRLYYCSRCDGVFIPGKTLLVPSDLMGGFLRLGSELESRAKSNQGEIDDAKLEEIKKECKKFGLGVEDLPWMMASHYVNEYREKGHI